MNQETPGSDSNFQGRCKSVMNVIRRAFSFREKRPTSKQEPEETSPMMMEMQPVTTTTTTTTPTKPRIDSLPSSDMPSTSATCSQPRTYSVYEDPFVAVISDGTIYIKNYYNFNERAEFQLEPIRYGYVKRNSRIIKAKDVDKIYYAAGTACRDRTRIKNWGICINNVWWASHHNRLEECNTYTNVVLFEGSLLWPGFSVINIDAFAESLQCVGLPTDAPFQGGIPNPPLSLLKIPFIDEDEDETLPKRKGRRAPSKVQKTQ